MDFTIYRDSWRRGGEEAEEEFGPTNLLNRRGMMCCLGQTCAAMGVPANKLLDCAEPADIADTPMTQAAVGVFIKEEGFWGNTKLSNDAIPINDSEAYYDPVRETTLTELFARYGHTIKFVDGKAPEAWTKVGV